MNLDVQTGSGSDQTRIRIPVETTTSFNHQISPRAPPHSDPLINLNKDKLSTEAQTKIPVSIHYFGALISILSPLCYSILPFFFFYPEFSTFFCNNFLSTYSAWKINRYYGNILFWRKRQISMMLQAL